MRRELIVCDICKQTRDAKEPGGAVLQAFFMEAGQPEQLNSDLCDSCWQKALGGMQARVAPATPQQHAHGARRLERA